MKNAFYFMSKAPSMLLIFPLMSWLFGHVEIQPDKKAKVNFKIFDVRDWTTNNYNTNIAQISQEIKTTRQWNCSLIKCNLRNIFLQKFAENDVGRLVLDLF